MSQICPALLYVCSRELYQRLDLVLPKCLWVLVTVNSLIVSLTVVCPVSEQAQQLKFFPIQAAVSLRSCVTMHAGTCREPGPDHKTDYETGVHIIFTDLRKSLEL